MFSQDEISRYSRHFLLPGVGEAGQERLRAARVLIVGLGGLGSPAALYLASAGIGKIGLVDDDQVSLSNLQRQILYTSSDSGISKAQRAGSRLKDLNPNIEVALHAHKLDRSNALDLVQNYDLVLDGTDNFESRYVIARACAELKKPHLYAGLFRFEGQLALFEPGHACYACLFPSAPKQEDVPNCSEAGVLGPLAGTMGTLQALEALKYFLNLRTSTNELVLFDGLSLRTDVLKISRRADCPNCMKPTSNFWNVEAKAHQEILAFENRPTDAWVLDVRTLEEIQARPSLPEASRSTYLIHIPLSELKDRLGELDPKQTYLAVCQSGKRSLRAQAILTEAGFPHVLNLRSGLSG